MQLLEAQTYTRDTTSAREGLDLLSQLHGLEELLDHLERTFGTEKFRRFWHSDRPMPEAFEATFGTPLGPWVRDWARDANAGDPIGFGAAMSGGQIALSLFWVFVAAGFAVVKGRRRQVG